MAKKKKLGRPKGVKNGEGKKNGKKEMATVVVKKGQGGVEALYSLAVEAMNGIIKLAGQEK